MPFPKIIIAIVSSDGPQERETWGDIVRQKNPMTQKTYNNLLEESGRCKLRLVEKDGKQGAGRLQVWGKLNF